jgi:hypothetical protein
MKSLSRTITEGFKQSYVNEKAYQLTGRFGAKGIPGKVLFAFKKEIEKIKWSGNDEETLAEINRLWKSWADTQGAKILDSEIQKVVKFENNIVYVVATLSNYEWVKDTVNDLNDRQTRELFVCLGTGFQISVGFFDDVNSAKYSKKLGGYNNSCLYTTKHTDVYGKFIDVGDNNIEITESLFLVLDHK